MQTILNDIELDMAELKYLLQALQTTGDPKLTTVASRTIDRMRQRLDELQQHLLPTKEETPHTQPKPETEPPHAEEKTDAKVCQDKATPSMKEEVKEEEVKEEEVKEEMAKQPAETESTAILAECIRPARDLRHALSLNDSFRFAREWFGGDVALLNDLLTRLGEVHTLDNAVTLVSNEVHCPDDNPALAEFEELLKKYFDR